MEMQLEYQPGSYIKRTVDKPKLFIVAKKNAIGFIFSIYLCKGKCLIINKINSIYLNIHNKHP